jgi:biopolymer transport protein TolQ
MWSLVFTGDWIALAILILLLAMSVFSWALIVAKGVQFRRVRGENQFFQDTYRRKSTLREIADVAGRLRVSPLARMCEGSYREINAFRASLEKSAGAGREVPEKMLLSPDYRDRMLEHLGRSQERVFNDQSATLERGLPLLAMISSASPFIGLFGTVLGIIGAFRNIGITGVTSLAVVAPGISEALVATAAGLFTAIPALVAYNIYRNGIRDLSTDMKNFALDFTNRLDRML